MDCISILASPVEEYKTDCWDHLFIGALRAVGRAQTAADVMNLEVVAVTETASVQETIEQMIPTGRKVPTVRDAEGSLKEIIGRSDLLRLLLEEPHAV